MRVSTTLLVIGAVIAAPVAVRAQEQTVEGAQKFLTQVFAAGGVSFYHDQGNGYNAVNQDIWQCRWGMTDAGGFFTSPTYGNICNVNGSNYWSAPAFTSASYKALTPCSGKMTGYAPNYSREYIESKWRKYTRDNIGPGDVTLDWARTAEVRSTGTEVFISGGGTRQKVYLPSESLATRVAYAMEFLRQNCDPTAGTGF